MGSSVVTAQDVLGVYDKAVAEGMCVPFASVRDFLLSDNPESVTKTLADELASVGTPLALALAAYVSRVAAKAAR